MISTISTPFVDTRAGDLVLSLTQPLLPAAAVRTIATQGLRIDLRLLKASHQVAVRRDGDGSGVGGVAGADGVGGFAGAGDVGGGELIETLACLPSEPAALPASYRSRCALGDYRTSVDVCLLAADALERTVERLLERYAEDDRYLIGQFPGDPLATTGIGLTDSSPGTISWRSWHAYPQERRLVRTTSLLQLRAADRIAEGVIR